MSGSHLGASSRVFVNIQRGICEWKGGQGPPKLCYDATIQGGVGAAAQAAGGFPIAKKHVGRMVSFCRIWSTSHYGALGGMVRAGDGVVGGLRNCALTLVGDGAEMRRLEGGRSVELTFCVQTWDPMVDPKTVHVRS